MVDLRLCNLEIILRVRLRQLVDHGLAALENRQIGDHGVPVRLRQGFGVALAVLDKRAAPAHQHQPFLGAALPDGERSGWNLAFIGKLRKNGLELPLRIAQLRIEFDAFHEDGLFLAVEVSRQTENPAFVYASRVRAEISDEPFLDGPEALDLGVLHQPVAVERLPGLDDQRRLQRKGPYPFQLFFQRDIIAFHELGVDAGDVRILMPAVVDDEIDPAPLIVMCFERIGKVVEVLQHRFQLLAGKRAVGLVAEHAQADFFFQVEKWAQEFLRRDVDAAQGIFAHRHPSSSCNSPKRFPAAASATIGTENASKGCVSIQVLMKSTASFRRFSGSSKTNSS